MAVAIELLRKPSLKLFKQVSETLTTVNLKINNLKALVLVFCKNYMYFWYTSVWYQIVFEK